MSLKRSRAARVTAALLSTAALAAQDPPQQPPVPMLIPQAVVLPRADRALTVDGSLIDWPELPAINLADRRQLSGTALNAWHGPADASAVVFLLWDAEALWVGAAVKDEWHRALDATTLQLTEIPVADSLLLTFDPARDTRGNGNDPGRNEDRDVWLGDEAGRRVVLWDRLRGGARLLDTAGARAVVLHDKEQGITTYEARLPWSELLPSSTKVASGLVFDLQIVLNDFDESTDTMPQTRIGWTFGCGPLVDPGLFGSVMLVADSAALQGVMPEFPPKPGTRPAPTANPEYWRDLTARLLQLPPVVHDGSKAPEVTGGSGRLRVLEEIDRHCARFPRVDFLELHQRIHRRMRREVDGTSARGLPSWWAERLLAVAREAADPVAEAAVRVARLPMGGWSFRTPKVNFVVDPAGGNLEQVLWGAVGFCLLTQPLDLTRRNDQLLVRMFTAEPVRPLFTHIAFHMPLVPMDRMPLVELGRAYEQTVGSRVTALGERRADGLVTSACSYLVELPGGTRILVVSPDTTAAEVGTERVDLLLLSPLNPELLAITAAVQPGLVLLDDVMTVQHRADVPRVSLQELHDVQRRLLPWPSLLLAPGESWTIAAK